MCVLQLATLVESVLDGEAKRDIKYILSNINSLDHGWKGATVENRCTNMEW